ncbi:MAG: HAD family phosphatase [Chloroflexi bacterium]|nr:HAD family phosphatase [Chloroflexota bacterium]
MTDHLIRAIIFDLGGVLLDWDPRYVYREVFGGDEAAVDAFLAEIDFYGWNMHQDAGRSFDEAAEALCAQHPRWCEQIRLYGQRYVHSFGGAIEPTVAILRQLKAAGWPLVALSNFPPGKFDETRARFDFLHLFDDAVISGDVKLTKPDARIYRLAVERAGCRAEQCVFIDDVPANVAAAASLGIDAIRFESAEQLAGDLKRRGIL